MNPGNVEAKIKEKKIGMQIKCDIVIGRKYRWTPF